MDIIDNTSASIYADFGVTNATVSGELTEHEKAMISLATDVRDGDDKIKVIEEETQDEAVLDTPEVGTESGDEGSDPEVEEPEEVVEGEPDDTELPEGTTGEELAQLEKGLKEHDQATQELLSEAVAKGLPAEIGATINAEYASGKGLSEETYEALSKAGYSKGFINSYIAGQEAVAQQFANSVVAFAGGQEAMAKIQSYMKAHNPEAAESFNEAVDRVDSKSIKALITMTKTMMGKSFGSRPARVISAAKQSVTAPVKTEGYASQSDMVAAMSDPRYSRDASYRKSVEAKVAVSSY